MRVCSVVRAPFQRPLTLHVLTTVPVALVCRVPLLIIDLLVLVVTCKATYGPYREARRAGIRGSLSASILQSGTYGS